MFVVDRPIPKYIRLNLEDLELLQSMLKANKEGDFRPLQPEEFYSADFLWKTGLIEYQHGQIDAVLTIKGEYVAQCGRLEYSTNEIDHIYPNGYTVIFLDQRS